MCMSLSLLLCFLVVGIVDVVGKTCQCSNMDRWCESDFRRFLIKVPQQWQTDPKEETVKDRLASVVFAQERLHRLFQGAAKQGGQTFEKTLVSLSKQVLALYLPQQSTPLEVFGSGPKTPFVDFSNAMGAVTLLQLGKSDSDDVCLQGLSNVLEFAAHAWHESKGSGSVRVMACLSFLATCLALLDVRKAWSKGNRKKLSVLPLLRSLPGDLASTLAKRGPLEFEHVECARTYLERIKQATLRPDHEQHIVYCTWVALEDGRYVGRAGPRVQRRTLAAAPARWSDHQRSFCMSAVELTRSLPVGHVMVSS